MTETYPTQNDEIDLFELLKALWDGKWKIGVFVAIAFLIGGVNLFLKDNVYESKLIYSVETIPPFISKEKALNDFKNKFYSASIFEEWKQNNIDSSLVFEDFRTNRVVDGFIFSKNKGELLATLVSEKGVSFVLVKSNQPPILNDFFKYATNISEKLVNEYIHRAEREMKIRENVFSDLNRKDGDTVEVMLTIDRYIFAAEKGGKVFNIHRPTMPRKVSPKNSILALYVALGGIVGTMYVLFSNYIRKRKEYLASA